MKPETLKDLTSGMVWNVCLDLGIYRHSKGAVTLSHGFLKLIIELYERYRPEPGEFASRQEKLVGAIRTAVDLVVENCKVDLDKEFAIACGLIGFLLLLKADAKHDREMKVVWAADQMLQHGSSAKFNLKAVVKYLKWLIQTREEAGLVDLILPGITWIKPKILGEYPLGVWFEAADECEYCKSKYEVRIHKVDELGLFGTVEWRIHHKPYCTEGASVTRMDTAGWRFMKDPFILNDKLYFPLKSRANIGLCLECGKLIIGAPLILFTKKGELDFCWNCAEKLKILEMVGLGLERQDRDF